MSIPYGKEYPVAPWPDPDATPDTVPDVDPYIDVPLPAEPPVDDRQEDRTAAEKDNDRAHLRTRLLNVSQLSSLPPTKPLVDGLLYRNTIAQLSAAPGSYKSFAAIGIACAVALGMNWEGHRVPKAEPVVYVAAEGASGLEVRIKAWCELTGIDPADLDGKLYILPCPVQLGNGYDVSDAVDIAEEIGAGLVILDTRAKSTVGLEENSATEQGKAVAAAEQIQQSTACTVFLIHHTGRVGTTPRGSSAWDGAVWSDLRMEGSDLLAKIHCEKHKDVPDGCDHHFRLIPHTVSELLMPDIDEDDRKTLVFVQNDSWTFASGGTKSDRVVLDIIGTSATSQGLSPTNISEIAEDRDVKRSTVFTSTKRLLDAGKIRNVGTETRHRYVITSTGQTELDAT